jgi:hypothetical protein
MNAEPTPTLLGESYRQVLNLATSAFARSSFGSDKVIIECAWVAEIDTTLINVKPLDPTKGMVTGILSAGVPSIYRVALAVKSTKPGDASGKNNEDAIEQAAGQVCKGTNGLIEFFNAQANKLPRAEKLYFLPGVFTTAKLWVTDTDLATAELDRGEFETGAVEVKEKTWIWYQYNLSPGVKHSLSAEGEESRNPFDLSAALEQDFTRSIAIVSVNGIEDFLKRGFPFR